MEDHAKPMIKALEGYPATPEADKMIQLQSKSQPAGEFLEWLQERGVVLAKWDEDGESLHPLFGATAQGLLADWLGVDLAEIERERTRILQWLRKQQS